MTSIISLIENAKKTKKDSVASTIRMPELLNTFVEMLANDLELSKQETMLALLQQGAADAQQKLDEMEKAELLQLAKAEEIEQPIAPGFHILNTNKAHNDEDHEWMLAHKAAAAFYSPWKFNIDRIKKGEVVYLYENGKGIVAYGHATGEVRVRDHEGEKDECHYQILDKFKILEKPLSAAAIKKVLERNVVFLRTMSGMPDGQKVLDLIQEK